MIPKNIIYGLVDPDSGTVRYIGKSTSGLKRPNHHFWPSSLKANTYKNNWLNKVLATGRKPEIRIIAEFPDDCSDECLNGAEIFWIANYRKMVVGLTNTTDGGEGLRGYVATPEHRAKNSAAQKGRIVPPEHRAKLSAAGKGRVVTPKTRAKMSAANKGKPKSPEHCANLSAAGKGRVFSPEWCAKISAANKGKKRKPHTPETRAKLSAANKGHIPTPEARAKISRPVLCLTNGITYPSVNAAARALDLQVGNISKCANGKRAHTGGFKFTRP